MNFKGKIAVLTGAASARGFGRLTALMLAKRGCDIIVWDVNEEGAKETAKLCEAEGVRAAAFGVDLTSEAQIKDAAAKSVELFGRIDILINNAGITQSKKALELTLEEWNRMISIDLTSIFLTCREIAPIMVKNGYGRIVNVSSVSGRNGGGVFGGSHYCAAKAGVIGFSKALAKELATTGVTVNCVAPGSCKTDIGGRNFEVKPHPVGVPMDRRGETVEVATPILFLASENASFITGHTIDVNGGLYMV